MAIKQTCTKCHIPKSLDQFSDANYGRYGKRSSCKACDRLYQDEYLARKKRTPRKKVNFEERINVIVKFDKQATQLLSCGDHQGLRSLAVQMKEFGLIHRAKELEEYG
jgi:hypothetical protein